MKKVLWSVVVIITASIIVMACQKGDTVVPATPNTTFDGKAAKEWYYGTFKGSGEWEAYNAGVKGKRLPDWSKGISQKVEGWEIMEFPFVKEKNPVTIAYKVPLSVEDKKKIAEASLSRIVFLRNKKGNIRVREMQYVPDMDYLARHHFDISTNSARKVDNDFSGMIITSTWGGEELSRKLLTDGKITGSFKKPLSLSGSLADACPTGSTQVDEYERDCESHLYGDGMFTYQCGEWLSTGNQWCIDEEEIEDDPDCEIPNSPQCSCSLFGTCDDPGGEGPGSVPEIINNVLNPCIRNSVNDAISGGCKNQITGFINTTFANSDKFHLQFNDGILLGSNAGSDAYTICGQIPNSDEIKTTINFNTAQLVNASKEYIAATLLHESIHAWIDYKYPNPVESAQQHQMMAGSGRFNLMRDALMEMCPNLSLSDATDLTWGGLFNTVQFLSLSPAEQARIGQKNIDFKNHTAGTPC